MTEYFRDGMWVFGLLYASNIRMSNSGYYTLLLIPLGALFCLAIRKLSDIGMVNRGICIGMSEGLGKVELLKVSNKLFQQALEHAQQQNNMMLAVEGMAVRLGELTKIMGVESGMPLNESGVYKMVGHAIGARYGNVAAIRRDLICVSDTPYKEACAGVLYERRLDEGLLRIKKRVGVDEFLERCRTICYNDLNLGLMQLYTKKDCAEISTISSGELGVLKSIEGLYYRGNALLLFLELSKRVEVVGC